MTEERSWCSQPQCSVLGPGLGGNYPVCFTWIFLRELTALLPAFPSGLTQSLCFVANKGAKPEAAQTQHRSYCGIRDLYTKHKSTAALMII